MGPLAIREVPISEFPPCAGRTRTARDKVRREAKTAATHCPNAAANIWRETILRQNIPGKTTDSTSRNRHATCVSGIRSMKPPPFWDSCRSSTRRDPASLPLLAMQIARARDPLLRATIPPVANGIRGPIRLTMPMEPVNPRN